MAEKLFCISVRFKSGVPPFYYSAGGFAGYIFHFSFLGLVPLFSRSSLGGEENPFAPTINEKAVNRFGLPLLLS